MGSLLELILQQKPQNKWFRHQSKLTLLILFFFQKSFVNSAQCKLCSTEIQTLQYDKMREEFQYGGPLAFL